MGRARQHGGSFIASYFYAGRCFSVTNTVAPDDSVIVYAVEDAVPSGWGVTNINDNGTFDAAQGTVQWGPFFDNQARALTYIALPPVLAAGVAVFTGTANFDSSTVAITGQRQTVPGAGAQSAPAVLLVHTMFANGQFQFDFTNIAGLPATLYATTNLSLPLSQWQTLGAPQSLGDGMYRFTDTGITNHIQRFYRLR